MYDRRSIDLTMNDCANSINNTQAEAFRLSLSAQLLHLLQEAEDRVQQRLREAARTHLLPPGQQHLHRPTEQPIGVGVDV